MDTVNNLDLVAAGFCRAAYMEPEQFSEYVGVAACHIYGPEYGADVYVFETAKFNWVVFRGTDLEDYNFRDLFTALKFSRERVEGGSQKLGLHRGMFEAWREVSDLVGEEILHLRLTQRHEDGEVKPTVYCGHSLGGAMAGMAAVTQGADYLITFGSPRWCGSNMKPLLEGIDARRYVYESDWCPRVPFGLGYRHVGQLHYLTRDGVVLKDASALRTVPKFILRFRMRWADHAMPNYVAALFASLLNEESRYEDE